MRICDNGTYRDMTPEEEKQYIESIDIAEEIAFLESELSATDYKIIKCYEYSLAGLDLPYDISKLHQERQEIRDKINTIQGGATDV